MENSYNGLTLETAYEIAGGYIEVDDYLYQKAIEMVEANSCPFVKDLKIQRNIEKAEAQKIEDEIRIENEAEDFLDNSNFIKSVYEDKNLKKDLFADEEIIEAKENTPIYDIDPQTQKRVELNKDDTEKHFDMLFEKAKLDVWQETIGSNSFSKQSDDNKRKSIFDSIKTSFLGGLVHLRTSAQIENEAPQAAEALENDNKNFFVTQSASILEKISKAINFKSKVKISSNSIMIACAETEKRTNKFIKRIATLAQKAKIEKKEFYSKVAIATHSLKSNFTKKAKKLWGERYTFIANMRDRKPKIITDLAATGLLLTASVTSAAWLAPAAITYGAYKATSSWVWPIITEARRNARIEKEKNIQSELTFKERLKNAANKVVGTKEYFKEAAWGSVAGLVGLGAIGATSVTGASVLLQRSAQSLASTSVYTANSLITTTQTLKNKKADTWTKGFAVLGAVVTTYFLTSCAEHTETLSNIQESQDTLTDTLSTNTSVNNETPMETNVQAEDVKQVMPIEAPSEYSESMGITKSQWNKLQTFWGSEDKYNEYYGKISDEMLSSSGAFVGKTREEILFQYQRLTAWNLNIDEHKETINKLRDFFEGCNDKSLNFEDVRSLDDVLPNGSIRNVNGTKNIIVTGAENNCGEETILHTKSAAKIAPIPDKAIIADTPTPDTKINIENIGGSTTIITETEITSTDPKINIVKANNLEDGKVIGTINGSTSDNSTDISNDSLTIVSSGGSTTIIEETTESNINIIKANNLEDGKVVGTIPNTTTDITKDATTIINSNESTDAITNLTSSSTHASNDAIQEYTSNLPKIDEYVDNNGIASTEPSFREVSDLDAYRGGFNNTGLTENQYNKLETFFQIRGEKEFPFEYYLSKITDDMLAKDGIFEGLTPEQALFSYKQMIEWSNNEVGEFKSEINTLTEYFNGCDPVITTEEAENIKILVDRVNTDGSIDGVYGSKCIQTTGYNFNDCGELGTHITQNVECGEATTPSGNKWIRMFKKLFEKVVEEPKEPDFVDLNTGVTTVTIVEDAQPSPEIKIIKANNLNDGKVVGSISVDDFELSTSTPTFEDIGGSTTVNTNISTDGINIIKANNLNDGEIIGTISTDISEAKDDALVFEDIGGNKTVNTNIATNEATIVKANNLNDGEIIGTISTDIAETQDDALIFEDIGGNTTVNTNIATNDATIVKANNLNNGNTIDTINITEIIINKRLNSK